MYQYPDYVSHDHALISNDIYLQVVYNMYNQDYYISTVAQTSYNQVNNAYTLQ